MWIWRKTVCTLQLQTCSKNDVDSIGPQFGQSESLGSVRSCYELPRSCMLATSILVSILFQSGCYSLHTYSNLYWGIKGIVLSGICTGESTELCCLGYYYCLSPGIPASFDIVVCIERPTGLHHESCCHNMATHKVRVLFKPEDCLLH